jgi:transcriptional regulator with XRE-family HTH domain
VDTFGGRLREARRRKVWRQEDLAAASGVAVVTISRLESGHGEAPRQSTVRKLADALDVDAAWLVFGEVEWEGKDAA